MIGSWIPLSGGRGATLAIEGNETAAAQLARLTVWSGERMVAQIDAPAQEPGRPRLAKDRALWGDGTLEFASGRFDRVKGIDTALVDGTDAPRSSSPSKRYAPATYAWSIDGEALVVSAAWIGKPGPPPARAVLLNGTGRIQSVLWQGSDLAPRAAWVGDDVLVLGTRVPRVFDRDGSLVAELAAETPPVRIEADAAEHRLLIVEHGCLTVWNMETWTIEGVWPGSWLDADLAPDGQLMAALDFSGRLHLARIEESIPVVSQVTLPDQPRGIALGDGRLAVAFGVGEGVRTATVRRS